MLLRRGTLFNKRLDENECEGVLDRLRDICNEKYVRHVKYGKREKMMIRAKKNLIDVEDFALMDEIDKMMNESLDNPNNRSKYK